MGQIMDVLISILGSAFLIFVYAAAINAYTQNFNVLAYYLKMRRVGYSMLDAYELTLDRMGG
jgi:hypothetical protein